MNETRAAPSKAFPDGLSVTEVVAMSPDDHTEERWGRGRPVLRALLLGRNEQALGPQAETALLSTEPQASQMVAVVPGLGETRLHYRDVVARRTA